MSFETGIHIIIFLSVLVVTGIILTRKKRNTALKNAEESDIEEIQAEIFDAENYRRQAQADRLKAKLELEEAKKIKRRALNQTDEILTDLKETKHESK